MIPNTVANPRDLRAIQRWVRMTTVYFVILGAAWALMDANRLTVPPPEVSIPVVLAVLVALGVQFNTLLVTRVTLMAMIGAGVVFLYGFGLLALLYAGVILVLIAAMDHHTAGSRSDARGPLRR